MIIKRNSLIKTIRPAGVFYSLVGCILAWTTNTYCQEFTIINNEIKDLDTKLTQIIENETAQRKASDKSILNTISKEKTGLIPASDSALNAEMQSIAKNLQKNKSEIDSLAINLTTLARNVDSLSKVQADLRVVSLAKQLQNIVDDLKKQLSERSSMSGKDMNVFPAIQSKIETMEKEIAVHDSCLFQHTRTLAEEDKRVASHDSIIGELTNALHRQFGTPAIQGAGFSIGVNATMILQGTNNSNAVTAGTQNVADASYAAEVTFAKDFDKVNGKAFLRDEAGQGNGINQDLLVFCNANASAYPGQGIWVAEAWYEQKLLSGKFDGTIGYLMPAAYIDNNSVANDQTTQFLSAMFVNNPALEMPVYTPGAVVKLMPIGKVELLCAMFDADASWQRIGDDLFNVAQVSLSPVAFGLAGDYHLYGWYNGQPHHRWDNPGATEIGTYGCGVSVDQQVSDVITVFGRYGWRNQDVYDSQAVAVAQNYTTLISQSWSTGAQVAGKPWHRDDDALGIGYGQTIPSVKYKEAMALANAEPESHFEIYYRIKCFEHMGISPDFQYIINPFGKDRNPFSQGTIGNTGNIAIAGIRSMVDF